MMHSLNFAKQSLSISTFVSARTLRGKYVGDSFDDFRLAFEWALLDSDMNINLTDLYLTDRYGYGCCVRPETGSKPFVTAADLFLYRDADATQFSFEEISYWEAQHLLKRIQQDMVKNDDEQKRLDMIFCKPQGYQYNYIASLQKTTYPKPKTITEWYTIKRALEMEHGKLWNIEDQVKRIVETMKKPEKTVGTGASLYIYKGKTSCHLQNHLLVPATAVLHDEYDQEIELDVEYCPQCKRYMLNFVSFESYRERYGVLIGKLRIKANTGSKVVRLTRTAVFGPQRPRVAFDRFGSSDAQPVGEAAYKPLLGAN